MTHSRMSTNINPISSICIPSWHRIDAKMKNVRKAKFIERTNRFLARVELNGKIVDSFVPNPGRMHEFMIPGKTVFLRDHPGSHRKTDYDMIGVLHNGIHISIDSNLPNRFLKDLLEEHAFPYLPDYDRVTAEPHYNGGRFDFRLESDANVTLIEVKSCTLVEDGRALFPDARTRRGARHMRHLAEALSRGVATQAMVVFVIQRPDATSFSPHDDNDPEFGASLRAALRAGVDVIPITTEVVNWNLCLKERITFNPGPPEFHRS
jgi:sugar fermentation stimulation protein A